MRTLKLGSLIRSSHRGTTTSGSRVETKQTERVAARRLRILFILLLRRRTQTLSAKPLETTTITLPSSRSWPTESRTRRPGVLNPKRWLLLLILTVAPAVSQAGLFNCYYNEDGSFSGVDQAQPGEEAGGPFRNGDPLNPWRYTIDMSGPGDCPQTMPKRPPAPGEFATGGGSNGNDGFVLLRRSDGHVESIREGESIVPAMVQSITDARLVGAGRECAVIVHKDGSLSVYQRGTDLKPLPKIDDEVVSIVVNHLTVVLLHRNGSVSEIYLPRSTSSNGGPVADWADVAQLSADGSYAVTRQGKVLSHGEDRGSAVYRGISNARAVQANIHQGAALLADGTVRAWDRAVGPPQNRDAYNMPHPPAGLAGVIAVAAGDGFMLALKSNGSVVQWGQAVIEHGPPLPPPPDYVSDVIAIAASGDTNLAAAVKKDGTLVTWHPGRRN